MQSEVVITHGLRTPFAKAGTALSGVSAVELGRQAVAQVVDRADLDPADVDEVIMGCAGNPIDAANIARVIALRAGLPRGLPAVTVQRNCGSGLESITTALQRIRTGQARIVVAGGVESMSNYPLLFRDSATRIFEKLFRAKSLGDKIRIASRFRPRHFTPEISLKTGLTDPVCGLNMGETAEVLAKEFRIERQEQDEFALRSHRLATEAEEEGRFDDERIPFFLPPKHDDTLEEDVGPRPQQTMEALQKLDPVFDRDYGTVTAGNSSMVTDGAAAVVVMAAETAEELGHEPMGRIAGYGWAGLEPKRMGLGPCHATPVALDEAGVELDDIDLVELNEAFAAQVLACLLCFKSAAFAREELGRDRPIGEIPMEKLNVNGGAIALGHPVGTTGTRLVITLLNELERRGARRGLATMCIGGGQGGAVVLER